MRDHFSGGRGVWVLCKRAPATLYPHHSVGVLAAGENGPCGPHTLGVKYTTKGSRWLTRLRW
jgi:hypothetical protein